MANRIIMPKNGMAMEEGVIIQWFKKVGDFIEKGEPIAEIETDKVTMELESDYEGTLLKILYPPSSTVPVVETIAWIGEPGEEIPEDPLNTVPSEKSADYDSPEGPAVSAAVQIKTGSADGKTRATPAARRVAAENNLPLNEITPGGKSGEILERDVLAFKEKRLTSGPSRGEDKFPATPSPKFGDKKIKLTGIQKITGERMLKSHTEVPSVTESTKADLTELLQLRSRLNESRKKSISINDFILLATAKALRSNPGMNSTLEGDFIIYKGHINLGMAVATSRGLLVPVIPDADLYSLSEISIKARELSDKARSGELGPEEITGGTFTVSNLGMFGVTSFTPIINQPEAAILGVCTIEDQLKIIEGKVENRKIIGLSLTFDHRILDGAQAAVFMKTIKDMIETPQLILV